MTDTRIAHINKAKNHLGAASKRFKAASDMLDEVLKEVIPGWPVKPDDWDIVAPEHHLLADCRSTITAMKRQAKQMLQQVLHVQRIEMVRLRREKMSRAGGDTERPWRVVDESHEREGFICLAIRETESDRLVADLADHPNEIPALVERAKAEANILAHSRELYDTLRKMLDVARIQGENNFRNTLNEAGELIARIDDNR